ncbi:hypothetical protein TNCT_726791 [Trichonephila clavata]|uniref:Uncharacterized protein n=1 Tax=Trichonephila clavata TaxID=2740835 RepID=A0A8X6GZ35_TRICU|nr:hypothetical protein TNCT_726791 [Trichonephila clavata]
MSGCYLTLNPKWRLPRPKFQPFHGYRVQYGTESIGSRSRVVVKALSIENPKSTFIANFSSIKPYLHGRKLPAKYRHLSSLDPFT